VLLDQPPQHPARPRCSRGRICNRRFAAIGQQRGQQAPLLGFAGETLVSSVEPCAQIANRCVAIVEQPVQQFDFAHWRERYGQRGWRPVGNVKRAAAGISEPTGRWLGRRRSGQSVTVERQRRASKKQRLSGSRGNGRNSSGAGLTFAAPPAWPFPRVARFEKTAAVFESAPQFRPRPLPPAWFSPSRPGCRARAAAAIVDRANVGCCWEGRPPPISAPPPPAGRVFPSRPGHLGMRTRYPCGLRLGRAPPILAPPAREPDVFPE
jgi:hypothetical protein